jgi:hypothetical protein
MKEVIDSGDIQDGGQQAGWRNWRLNGIDLLHILFGVVWGIDAWFKWQPDFVNNYTDVPERRSGRPALRPSFKDAISGALIGTKQSDCATTRPPTTEGPERAPQSKPTRSPEIPRIG